MIAFFPELYPDELLYSVFCRYFDKSGYGVYRSVAEDIFINRLSNPDILFSNPLTNEIKTLLAKQKPWDRIIAEHTMYPYYARFLPQERRRRAYRSLVEMDYQHKDHLQMPKDGNSMRRFLRYCPCCRMEDHDKYGETYWHRIHQFHDIGFCPVHGCRLVESDVPIRSNKSPGFYSAETSSEDVSPDYSDNERELSLARYIADVFRCEVADTDTKVHEFLHERLAGSEYTSPRKKKKKMDLLVQDFLDYYKCLKDSPVQERWQLQKIADGKTFHTKGICMLAMFIGITPEELARMEMPEELHQDAFDRKIRELHEQGLKYPQIAEIMGASYDLCKTIGNGRYYKYNKGRGENKGGIKARDWDEYDRKMLPKVREAIKAIRNEGGRPVRVTFGSVARYIGMSEKRYLNLRLCREEVKKNYEDWEHYWAREMVFFYERIKLEGKPVTITAIMKMTNARRRNLIRGIPYLEQYTDRETAATIQELIKR